jgi:hypothetical protein
MGQQAARQMARREAMAAQATRRAARAERDQRLDAFAVTVSVELGEGRAALAAAELRAGRALRAMTAVEGLSVREAAQWCGGELSVREVTRLVRLAEHAAPAAGAGGDATKENATAATAAPSGGVGATIG